MKYKKLKMCMKRLTKIHMLKKFQRGKMTIGLQMMVSKALLYLSQVLLSKLPSLHSCTPTFFNNQNISIDIINLINPRKYILFSPKGSTKNFSHNKKTPTTLSTQHCLRQLVAEWHPFLKVVMLSLLTVLSWFAESWRQVCTI